MKILLVGENRYFAPSTSFAVTLAQKAENIYQADGSKALEIVQQHVDKKDFFNVVCVGEKLAGTNFVRGIDFVRTFAQRFPLTNCALMSGSSAKDFHEETEGLGIVMQIPVEPDAATAKELLTILQKISDLL